MPTELQCQKHVLFKLFLCLVVFFKLLILKLLFFLMETTRSLLVFKKYVCGSLRSLQTDVCLLLLFF